MSTPLAHPKKPDAPPLDKENALKLNADGPPACRTPLEWNEKLGYEARAECGACDQQSTHTVTDLSRPYDPHHAGTWHQHQQSEGASAASEEHHHHHHDIYDAGSPSKKLPCNDC